MYKALWAIAVVSALALGVCIFGTVVNTSNVHMQSVQLRAIEHQESVEERQIAVLQRELRAELAGAPHPGSP